MSNEDIAAELINGTSVPVKHKFEWSPKEWSFKVFNQGDLKELQDIENEGQKASMNIESTGSSGKEKVKDRVKRKQKTRDQVQKFQQEIDLQDIKGRTNRVKTRAIEISTHLDEEVINDLPPYAFNDLAEYIIMDVNKLTEDDLNLVAQFRKDE